ncbi:MAG: hypothetical protein U0996_05820 [Planctomycetaceae bacterium]
MTVSVQIRCPKCRTLLRVRIREKAAIRINCVRCGASLQVNPGVSESNSSARSANGSREPVDEQYPSDDPASEFCLSGAEEEATGFDSSEEMLDDGEIGQQLPPRSASAAKPAKGVSKATDNSSSWSRFPGAKRHRSLWLAASVLLIVGLSVAYRFAPGLLDNSSKDAAIPIAAAEGPAAPVEGAVEVAVADEAQIRSVQLKSEYRKIVVNESGGEFVGLHPDGKSLHWYTSDAMKSPRPEPDIVPIPSGCLSFAFKPMGSAGFYCLLCLDGTIQIIDAGKNVASRSIPIQMQQSSVLFCSKNPDDPWVFLFTRMQFAELTAINLLTNQVVHREYRAYLGAPQISASGKCVVLGNLGLYREDLLANPLDAPTRTFKNPPVDGSPDPAFFAHHDQFLVQGNLIIDTLSGTQVLVETKGDAQPAFSSLCGFQEIPILVGVIKLPDGQQSPAGNSNEIVLGTSSSNTLTRAPRLLRLSFLNAVTAESAALDSSPLASVPAAAAMMNSFRQATGEENLQLIPDDRNRQLYCFLGNSLKIVPASLLPGSDTSVVDSHGISPGPYAPGLTIRIPLPSKDGIRASLQGPLPEGAVLTDDGVEWTPTVDDIGSKILTFKFESDRGARILSNEIKVDYPVITIPGRHDFYHVGAITGAIYGVDLPSKKLRRFVLSRGDSGVTCSMVAEATIQGIVSAPTERKIGDNVAVCLPVGQEVQPALQVLELETLKSIATVRLKFGGLMFSSSQPGDSVLIAGQDNSDWYSVVDLKNLTETSMSGPLAKIACISPDGQFAVHSGSSVYLRQNSIGSGLPEFSLLKQSSGVQLTGASPVVDSESTFVGLNTSIFAPLGTLHPVGIPDPAILISNDTVVTMKNNPADVVLTKRILRDGELKEETSLKIPKPFVDGQMPGLTSESVVADQVGRRFLVFGGNVVTVRQFSELDIPDETPMIADVDGGLSFVAGVRKSVPLRGKDPGDRIEFTELPEGMTSDGASVSWTPGQRHAGVNLVQYTVHRGDRSVPRTLIARVFRSRSFQQRFLAGTDAGSKPAIGAPPGAEAEKQPRKDRQDLGIFRTPTTVAQSRDGKAAFVSADPAQVRIFGMENIDDVTSGKAIQTIDLGLPGLEIASKVLGTQEFFVVLSSNQESRFEIVVLNAQTFETIRKVPLLGFNAQKLVLSQNSNDPLAFVIASANNAAQGDSRLLAVNLETGDITSSVVPNVRHAVISPDGSSLVVANDDAGHSLLWLHRADIKGNDPGRFRAWKQGMIRQGPLSAFDPSGNLAAIGGTLLNCSLKEVRGNTPEPFIASCFLQQQPFLIAAYFDPTGKSTGMSTSGITVCAFDVHTMERVGRPICILDLDNSSESLNHLTRTMNLIPDESRGRICCVLPGNEVVSVAIEELQIPATVDLNVRFRFPERIEMFKPCEIELELPQCNPPATIAASSLRPGMELKGNRILWTPNVTDFGLSEISITLRHGDSSHTSTRLVCVERGNTLIDYHETLFALSTLDGSILTVNDEGKSLLRYSIEDNIIVEKPSGTLALGKSIDAIIARPFKDKHLILAGSQETRQLIIVDAVTMEVISEIPLEDGAVGTLQSSQNPDDPFVYFYRSGKIFAASLETNAVAGCVFPEAENFAIAPSGVLGYLTVRTNEGFTRIEPAALLNQLTSAIPQFSSAVRLAQPTEIKRDLIQDDYGITTIVDGIPMDAGNLHLRSISHEQLSQLLMKGRQGRVEYGVGFLDHGMTLLSLQRKAPAARDALVIQGAIIELIATALDGKVLGRVDLTVDEVNSPFGPGFPPPWRVLTDQKNDRIVCVDRSQVLIVPAAQIREPSDPALKAVWSGPRVADVAKESRWSLLYVPDNIKVDFTDLPEGATVADRTLTWTPANSQVGRHVLRAKLRHGTVTVNTDFEINVSWPTITLPFSPAGIATEDPGPRVAVWQRSEIVNGRILDNNCGYLQVVNTATRQPVFEGRLLPENPRGEIDHGVIVGERFFFTNRIHTGSQLWWLPLDGSAAAKEVDIPEDCTTEVGRLKQIGNYVVLEFADQLLVYDSTTLQLTKRIKPIREMVHGPILEEDRFGLLVYGTVVDEHLKSQLCIRAPWYSDPLVTDAQVTEEERPQKTGGRGSVRNGGIRVTMVFDLEKETRNEIEEVPNANGNRYVGVGLQQRPFNQHWSRRITADLLFEDSSGVLLTRSLGSMDFRLYDEFVGFHYAPRTADVIVCAGRRLMMLPYPKPEELQTRESKRFAAAIPTHNTVLLPSEEPVTLKHDVMGDSESLKPVAHLPALEGLKVQSDNLTVEIDPGRLRSQLTQLRAQATLAAEVDKTGAPQDRINVMITKLRDNQSVQAKEVLGYHGNDLLEAVPITIDMVDSDGQKVSSLSYVVFVELKVADLQATVLKLLK